MYCFHCGAQLDNSDFCPVCNASVHYYKKIVATANQHYNMGLRRAKERDLHGAVQSLQQSLRLYKMNTDARNLLGLVYYEMGNYPSAITEWSISRALQPEYNAAEEYLEELIGGVRRDDLNQDIRKYNQALVYNAQGNDDLALIQLKKVVSDLPNFIEAHKLLALIYTKQGAYDEARAQIRIASRIDRRDRELQRYAKMISREKRSAGGKRRKRSADSISYQSGTQTIIQPKASVLLSARAAAVNILIGLLLGLVVFYFLTVPALRASIYQEANQTVVEAQERAAAEAATVDALEAQIETLTEQVQAYASADAENEQEIAQYQHLIAAYQAVLEEDTDTAKTELEQVDTSLLNSAGTAVYAALYTQACSDDMAALYTQICEAYTDEDYETVFTLSQQLTAIQEDYGDGEVLLYLGVSCYKLGDTDSASQILNTVVTGYENYARVAQSFLDEIEAAAGE